MRTPESAVDEETALPALLRVAWSVLQTELLVVEAVVLLVCGAVTCVEETPRIDFKPSKLLRMSISFNSFGAVTASLPFTIVIWTTS